MSPRIIECVQGSDEWNLARCGIVTASEMSDCVAGGAGLVRSGYMRRLAGEIITGIPAETYQNGSMARGKDMEAEIRATYAMVEDVDVDLPGFVVNDGLIKGRTIGASPDGLIRGTKRGVEVKSEKPEKLILRLRNHTFPTEHLTQLQAIMWVCELEAMDIVIGYRKMPPWKRRVLRDDNAIGRLKIGVSAFLEELDAMVKWLREYRQ